MRGRWRWLVLLLVLAFPVPGPVEAQRPTGRQERARMEAQLRERFEALVERELELNPETSAELAGRTRAFAPRRRELARERRLLQREMGEGEALAEERALEILDDMARLARQEAELLAEEQASLLEILTPPQVVRLYGLRERLGRRIRELGRRGPGAGPGPGGRL